ncbi:MAG TPA: non-heme iron oxygenase ferredoxin subunit [Gammaproteobacteria bacterium]|nr:non-heme iron oxygenase ferredoxin subunit [Gammaproteobacteria bacterium]
MAEWIDIAAAADLPPGRRVHKDVNGVAIIVINLGGELLAVEDVCTHDGTPLDEGEIIGGEIICPRHGARFCLRTGRAMCPPAYEPIATFKVRVEAGRVQVRV